MKKILLMIIFILAFTVTACSSSISDEQVNTGLDNEDSDLEELNLQIQKADEEAGVTVENSNIYGGVAELIESNPSIGIQDDFSIHPYDIAVHEDGSESMVFLAINRLNEPIKNMSFELTFGNQNGDYIFDDKQVFMEEKQIGILEPNDAVPVLLDITPEGEEVYDGLTQDNVELDINNFDTDIVE